MSSKSLSEWTADARAAIRAAVAANTTQAAISYLMGRFATDIIAPPLAWAAWRLDAAIATVARQITPYQATEPILDWWGGLVEVFRLEPRAAVVELAVETAQPVEITPDFTWIRGDGVEFTPTETKTIDGPGTIRVTCAQTGTIGDTEIGDTLRLATPAANVSQVARVIAGGVGGLGRESDDDLRIRVIEGIQGGGAQGGSVSDWVAWVWAAGVASLSHVEVDSPSIGWVRVRVSSSDAAPWQPLGPGDLAYLATYLEARKPIEGRFTVENKT